MPQLIDIAEVEAAMEEFRINERKKTELPGFQGAVARAQLAVLPALTIWRAKEMNRPDGDPNIVMNALVCLVAVAIVGEAQSAANEPKELADVLNRTLLAIAGEMAAMVANQRDMTAKKFNFTEAGNA